jgi:hypothetical protein
MFDNYRYRTDNLIFPNTEESWKKLGWKLHFISGRSLVMIHHLQILEYKARKHVKQSNTSDQDDVSQGVLD